MRLEPGADGMVGREEHSAAAVGEGDGVGVLAAAAGVLQLPALGPDLGRHVDRRTFLEPLDYRQRFWFRIYGLGCVIWMIGIRIGLILGIGWWMAERMGGAGVG